MEVEDEQESKRMRMINGLSMIPSHALPPEIIVEILLRCPVETVLRSTETFSEVLPPVYDNECNRWITLGALGDWLCVLLHYKNEIRRADLWVMKVYGVKDSWTKLVSIPYVTHEHELYEVPLSVSYDGKFLLKINHKLLVYDSINWKFDEIHDFGARFEACSLVESLVSPHLCLLDVRSWRLNRCTWMSGSGSLT
nr:F-box associated interaction domain-containing protein [Tanacetum cinerariifolium]